MNYIDLTLQEAGSGVSDYDLLSNQPQINGVTLTGDKSSTDLGIFLPDGYTITVATDGSGDFTDIQSALDSLQGKVCAGTVTINIAAGTYTVSSTLIIQPNCVYNTLVIKGAGVDNTIIQQNGTFMFITQVYSDNVTIQDLQVYGGASKPSHDNRGISVYQYATRCIIRNVKIAGCNHGVETDGSTTLDSTIYIINCVKGIVTGCGHLNTGWGTTFNCNNVTTAVAVFTGGSILLYGVNKAFTNVTNQTNQSIGSVTAQGFIGGQWLN